MPNREIRTCSRCRQLKLRCDRTRPSCWRCTEASVSCSYRIASSTPPTSDELPASATETTVTESNLESPNLPDGFAVHLEDHDEASAGKTPKIVKRRQRAHLSCLRCFRLKVKCDKELPCSRCRVSGWARNCAYNHRLESNATSSALHPPAPLVTRHDANDLINSWHAHRRGATHCEELLSQLKLQASRVDIMLCDQVAEIIREQKDKKCDSVLPCNFPFNSPEAVKFVTLDAVYDLLQSHREMCRLYIDGFLALYQTIHPIIDVAPFRSMVQQFWSDPKSVEVSWLASFLMVLALGCFALTRSHSPTVEFCMAAETCLSKTPFMVTPDLAAIQTLCLMVIAKQTTNTTCRTFDLCWAFLGIVIRAAVGINLGMQPPPPNQLAGAIHEWQRGRILWSLIIYFCIHMATITGKPPLIAVDIITAKHTPPSHPAETADPWLTLAEAYPEICHIIARVNSDTDKPSYNEVQQYNDQLRQSMVLLDNIRGRPLLYITLDIFFRRLLLVLHRQYALHSHAPLQYPVSYWSSLECSLAILVHHRYLCEHEGRSPGNIDLLSRLFKLDFFSAMLTVCLHLLRHDAPLAKGIAIPPRQTILDTLQACTEIWGKDIHNSICFSIGHRLLTSVLGMLLNRDGTVNSECGTSETLNVQLALP